jgi:Family of unknown function (DUF6069)/Sulphur transport
VSHSAPTGSSSSARLEVDGGRLWAGGLAAALVAVLAVVVGYLVIDSILKINLVKPVKIGDLDVGTLGAYIGWAAVATLLATALIHLLALTTPRPRAFFGWIITLATAAAAAWPFSQDVDLDSKIASSALVVVVGIVIGSLVLATAARTIRIADGLTRATVLPPE